MKKILNFVNKNKVVFLCTIIIADFLVYFLLKKYYDISVKNLNSSFYSGEYVDASIISLMYKIASYLRIIIIYILTFLVGYSFLNKILGKYIKNKIINIVVCAILSFICGNILSLIISVIINSSFNLSIKSIANAFLNAVKSAFGINIIESFKNIPGETDVETFVSIIMELVYAIPLIEMCLLIKEEGIKNEEN